ncbi:hypothetical protein [Oceanobacillus sp. Castelsardo]|uniref:hypothetical protein n=1 Tax=Oceanobacillus sp. Castelsardo TaxID=1851204 RepID=UPI000837D107|nr:hypothetical protein [Oceanobacillus sp. Castelsardo]
MTERGEKMFIPLLMEVMSDGAWRKNVHSATHRGKSDAMQKVVMRILINAIYPVNFVFSNRE